jgi:hypothetical protein
MLPHELARLAPSCRRRHQQHELYVQFARLPEAPLAAVDFAQRRHVTLATRCQIIERSIGCLEGLAA